MNNIERLARKVCAEAAWPTGTMVELQGQLDELTTDRLAHELTIEAARNNYTMHSCADIEIDDDPFFSVADEGVWVSAWVWVPIETEAEGEAE